MYVPAHFALPAEAAAALLASAPAGDLVTTGPDGLTATFLPLALDPDTGSLVGHLARVNQQWRHEGPALFLVHGPDAYVASEWLRTPAGEPVPTWNYVTVQVHAQLVAHDDPDWTIAALSRLGRAHGDDTVPNLDAATRDKLLRSIVGIELAEPRVVGKAKMSQNKTPDVVAQVISGLEAGGESETAAWMAEHSLPRAQAKADLLAGLRQRHERLD